MTRAGVWSAFIGLVLLSTSAQAQSQAVCFNGSDGRAACGYACKVGSDGVARCAETPDGACIVQSNGRVACTDFQPARFHRRWPQAECVLGSNGLAACGYACKVGSDGIARCAQTPDGACIVQSNGRVACTDFTGTRRHGRRQQATCLLGSNGLAACGYACQAGSDGIARCAQSPEGACIVQANGRVACSD